MSVFHCPLCPLIFQYRNEAESHLRQEHRSRADEDTDLRAELAAAAAPLDWTLLRRLRSSTANPSVTLLLATVPAGAMTVLDIAVLRQLADRARRLLSARARSHANCGVVEHRLSKAVSAAESLTTDRGLAVMVNQHQMAMVRLPFAPHTRQVVGPGFATRDLDRALRCYPTYRVVVLGRYPRVLEGHAHNLTESAPTPPTQVLTTAADAEVDRHPDEDRLLDRRTGAGGRLPLVVVGDRHQLSRFRSQSSYAKDVVAEVPRHRLRRTSPTELARQALAELQHRHRARSVSELLHADMQAQVAWGLDAAWKALRSGRADRLWVAHDYWAPEHSFADNSSGADAAAAEPETAGDPIDVLLVRAERLGVAVDILDKEAIDRPEPVAVRMSMAQRRGTGEVRSLATA